MPPDARDPLVRAFGAVLRGHREAAKLSRPQLAESLGCSAQWIEKIETGRKPPSEATADDLDTYFKTTARTFHTMWLEIKEAAAQGRIPLWFRRWVDVEKQAHTLKNWEPLIFPGLLQTREYASDVIRRQPGITVEQVEERLAARLDRQTILARENPVVLFSIIDEGVLHRPLGTPEVMRGQLAHVLEMSSRSNITIQVVPLEAGASCGFDGAFWIANLDREADTVYLESNREGRITDHPADIAEMSNRYAAISADAFSKRQSLEVIAKAMEDRWSTN